MVELVNENPTRENTSRSLLIFDNADNTHLGSGIARLDKYMPRSRQCPILLTTINNDAAKILAPENTIELGGIAPDTTQKMFENHLHTSISAMEQLETKHLIRELACHPLALVQAAAYINVNNIMAQEYRIRLVGLHEEALEHENELTKEKQRGSGAKDPVSRTLLLSMDQIRHVNRLASNYLSFVACLDQRNIPLELLRASSTHCHVEEAISLLDDYALIRRRQAESAIDIHQLVHSALRKELKNRNILDQWRRKTIKQLLNIFPDPDHSDRHKWRRLLPRAKCILSQSISDLEEGPNKTDLRRKCGIVLLADERYNEAQEQFAEATETYKTILGSEHPATLVSMSNLVSAIKGQGRWEGVEKFDVQVAETFKKIFGNDDKFTVTSMANLAATYRLRGQWKKAEEIELQVTESRRRMFKDDHPSTLTSLANLAAT
jgi:tetratricopeptide (TPR) repeat protein